MVDFRLLRLIFPAAFLSAAVLLFIVSEKRNGSPAQRFLEHIGGAVTDSAVWIFILVLPVMSWSFGLRSLWLFGGLAAGLLLSRFLITDRFLAYCRVFLKGTSKTAAIDGRDDLFDFGASEPSASSFLERRFNDRSMTFRIMVSFFVIIFTAGLCAAGLMAFSCIVSAYFSLPYQTALWGSAGFLAVCRLFCSGAAYRFRRNMSGTAVSGLFGKKGIFITGFFGFLLTAVLAALALKAAFAVTLPSFASALSAEAGLLMTPAEGILGTIASPGSPAVGTAVMVLSGLSWGLGFFGIPTFTDRLIRDFSSSDGSDLSGGQPAGRLLKTIPQASFSAKILPAVWAFLTGLSAIAVGLCARITHGPLSGHPAVSAGMTAGGGDLSSVSLFISEAVQPSSLSGVLFFTVSLMSLTCVFMSLSDLAGRTFVDGFYKTSLSRPPSDIRIFSIRSLFAVLIIPAAAIMVYAPVYSLLDMTAYPWTGFGAAFGAAVLFSLYGQNTTKKAVFIGIVVGGIFAAIWRQIVADIGVPVGLYEMIPAFILSALLIGAVSAASRRRTDRTVRREFDEMKGCLYDIKRSGPDGTNL